MGTGRWERWKKRQGAETQGQREIGRPKREEEGKAKGREETGNRATRRRERGEERADPRTWTSRFRRAGPSCRQPAAQQNPEEKVWLPKAESPRDGMALTQERLFKARRMTVCRTVINHADDGNRWPQKARPLPSDTQGDQLLRAPWLDGARAGDSGLPASHSVARRHFSPRLGASEYGHERVSYANSKIIKCY